MCGEYKNLFLLLDTNMGSPPHVWRILSCSSELFSALGITSTCVENTDETMYKCPECGDHLHIRGEYWLRLSFRPWSWGSPPHTWRIQVISLLVVLMLRITSTYVENTTYIARRFHVTGDHLHIRGEYWNSKKIQAMGQGSPPHTWRIQFCIYGLWAKLWITSTYVENTQQSLFDDILGEDHLHIRGEYLKTLKPLSALEGSPPHTWRIHNRSSNSICAVRITSTYVENTRWLRAWFGQFRDHLHIRGEYKKVLYFKQNVVGSPPHTWRIQ